MYFHGEFYIFLQEWLQYVNVTGKMGGVEEGERGVGDGSPM